MLEKQEKSVWRIFFLGVVIAGILALRDVARVAADKGFALTQPKWVGLIAVISFLILGVFFLLISTWRASFPKLKTAYENFLSLGERWRGVFYVFFGFSLFLLPVVVLHPYLGSLFGGRLWFKFFLFLLNTFVGASFLRIATLSLSNNQNEKKKLSWGESLAIAALSQLFVYRLSLELLYLSNYPFSLGWTRDSRYYDATRFFSERFYGQTITRPLINPSLYMILSIPFLFGKFPIWVYRGWSIFLTLTLSWGVAYHAFPHAKSWIAENKKRLFLVVWVFLYILAGSVYAHLLIPTLIIFAFVDPQKKTRSWVAIIVASLWAGISRINWFPVPAIFAALIYVMETELSSKEKIVSYFTLPFWWGMVGTLLAYLSKVVYGHLSGNAAQGSIFPSLTSYLIWERLLPNATYAPGILWGSILLSGALLALVIVLRPKEWHPLRWVAIISAILLLFVGGSVVSVKIGGGAELHNMDAYLISVLLVATTLLVCEIGLDTVNRKSLEVKLVPLFGAAILVVAWFILRGAGSWGYDKDRASAILNELQAQSTSVASRGEEVLFISQRHLLAVGLIEDIPLVADYENNFLMEMVMSQNAAYVDRFQDDLREQRFGLIVLNPQSGVYVDDDRSFAAENNLWVRKVTRPLWCYYELLEAYDEVGIELYVPRADTSDCD